MLNKIGLIENQQLIDEFVESCRVRGLKPQTLKTHRRLLAAIGRYVHTPFPRCTEYDWRSAVEKRSAEMGWTKISVWQAHSSVRALCRWMADTGRASGVAIGRKPGGSGKPSAANVAEMLSECDTSDPEQIIRYHGKPVSTLALAALWLTMAPGFLRRCVCIGDGERVEMKNRIAKSKKRMARS